MGPSRVAYVSIPANSPMGLSSKPCVRGGLELQKGVFVGYLVFVDWITGCHIRISKELNKRDSKDSPFKSSLPLPCKLDQEPNWRRLEKDSACDRFPKRFSMSTKFSSFSLIWNSATLDAQSVMFRERDQKPLYQHQNR